MPNKMLIDASHPEETRVVVLRGNRVEEFDFESVSKKQLRGNIYLAKVTRVEPSLQAAFVDYGGNRHGFLAFSEIHPDYYQIPVVDRQALIEDEARAQRDAEEEEQRAPRRSRRFRSNDRNGRRAARRHDDETISETIDGEITQVAESLSIETGETLADSSVELAADMPSPLPGDGEPNEAEVTFEAQEAATPILSDNPQTEAFDAATVPAPEQSESRPSDRELDPAATSSALTNSTSADRDETESGANGFDDGRKDDSSSAAGEDGGEENGEIEQFGGDALEEVPVHHLPRYRRQYKIQEVIKRRQVLLVQVVKEERGNKGAALTTYLSLAGRYSVLMPNTARGGGISRKITDSTDRQRLKSIAQELEVPEGMGVILRTAGAARTKAEVKRDFEYLLRMWETVRETTLRSSAPTLVYEEGSLIKRAIRDLYNKDIDEVVVAGDEGYREAKEFMRLLMPSHAKNVQPYRDPQPLFAKFGAEAQLDAMFSNQVTLKSGGYIVINQTEALVAIDVNSGRSTREHNIEDTALRTNLEAVDEIARQLRLRDLAGLIVLDLIDMEEGRNNRAVERRLKEALKNDRARIQVGSISHFGLLEMSRQRIRSGVLEGSTVPCPHCAGAGMVRSTASIALHVLRVLEDALIRNAAYDMTIKTRTNVALYVLNQKRANLQDLEARFGVGVTIAADDSLTGTTYYALERGELASGRAEVPAPLAQIQPPHNVLVQFPNGADEEETAADQLEASEVMEAEPDAEEQSDAYDRRDIEGDADGRPRRRRRRRRGRGSDRESSGIAATAPQPPDDALAALAQMGGAKPQAAIEETADLAAEIPELEAPLPELADPSPEPAALEETAAAAPAERRRTRRGRGARETSAATHKAAGEAEMVAETEAEPQSALTTSSAEPEAAPQRARRSRKAAPRARAAKAATPAPEIADEPASGDALAAFEPAEDHAPANAPQDETNWQPLPVERPAPITASLPEPSALMPDSLPTSMPEEQVSDRPKRSGWWQRAKASLRS
jgi:ribonuclease E